MRACVFWFKNILNGRREFVLAPCIYYAICVAIKRSRTDQNVAPFIFGIKKNWTAGDGGGDFSLHGLRLMEIDDRRIFLSDQKIRISFKPKTVLHIDAHSGTIVKLAELPKNKKKRNWKHSKFVVHTF